MVKPRSDLTPKAKRTLSALLDAARAVIGRKGAAGVTVMEVCEMAGVGRTSFYNYFDDVGALIETVAIEAAEAVKTRFDALHEGRPRGLDRLERCLTMILSIAADDRETALLLTSLAQNTGAIRDLLNREIMEELGGAMQDGSISLTADRHKALSQFLTISTLAITREIALKNMSSRQIAPQIAILLNACRTT